MRPDRTSAIQTQPGVAIEPTPPPLGSAGNEPDAPLSPAEIAELVGAFNGVAQRLQQTQKTLRAEVRRLESELSDSKKELKRARELAALGEMAAGIAHEIRNPLGSMKLYARMLIDDLADMPAERTTARKIADAVDRVNEIVTDVLALARDLKIEPRAHASRTLIEAALNTCCECLQSARVNIHIDNSIDHITTIRCDAPLMQQAIANIVRNACEAIAEWNQRPHASGSITIMYEQRGVLLSNAKRQTMDVITLTDNGPGISADAIERAFNPFYTTRETGTGLGLAIVHRVLDAHGGWARILNNADHEHNNSDRASNTPHRSGTTVELLLPAESNPTPSPTLNPTPDRCGAAPTPMENTHEPNRARRR